MRKLALVTALLLAQGALAHAAVPGWGTRSQVGQLVRKLDAPRQARAPGLVRRQPLLQKLAAFLRPGVSVKDDVVRLNGFLKEAEAELGAPISSLEHYNLPDRLRMRAEKAIALLAYGRRPAEVTETMLRTTATVRGAEDLAHRDLFLQRWRPTGRASGKVFVMAPGFLQTGRNFYEQVQLLNTEGHEVVLMDQQWAGYTADARRGPVKGGIDRGFGIARDVAEAAAYGNEILKKEYGAHPGRQLVVVGTSMGAGPGVVGALKLYDEGRIALSAGREIPADRGYILQGAFFGRRRSLVNDALDLAGRVPGLRAVPLPATGLPFLNDDRRTNAKLADHAVAEDVRGRAQAFRASLADLRAIEALIDRNGGPRGTGYAIHAEKDLLASPVALDRVAKKMPGLTVRKIPGRNHVIEETAGEQRLILDAAKHVTR